MLDVMLKVLCCCVISYSLATEVYESENQRCVWVYVRKTKTKLK